MHRDGLKRAALSTLCIGGGRGIALAIETAHQIVIRSSRIGSRSSSAQAWPRRIWPHMGRFQVKGVVLG